MRVLNLVVVLLALALSVTIWPQRALPDCGTSGFPLPADVSTNGHAIDAGGTTGADQIGKTTAMGQINHEVCVDGYGAKGDGTTDDGAAIQAAIDACGNSGCTVKFDCTSGQALTAPKTYIINSSNGHGGSAAGVQAWYNNIVIDLNGATLQAGASLTSNVIALGSDFGLGNAGCFESPTLYAVTGATYGSTVLTMVTGGQESNFTAGNPMYIEGEHTDNMMKGNNFVDAIDSTNHKLYLRYPLGRTYTPTPQVAPETTTLSAGHPSCMSHNVTLKNGGIKVPSTSSARGIAMYLLETFRVENITQDYAASSPGDSPTDISIWNGQFVQNRFTNRCGDPLNLSSRGNANIQTIGGIYTARNNDGVACVAASLAVSAAGEATENISWIGGQFTNSAGTTVDQGIALQTSTVNPVVQGVIVNLTAGAATSNGIGFLSGGIGTNVVKIIGNTVNQNVGVGINLRSSVTTGNTIANGNIVTAIGSGSFQCARLNGMGVFTGNTCVMNGQSAAIEVAAEGAVVSNNTIFNLATGGVSPVLLDNGSTLAFGSVIMGNVDENPANYSSGNFVTAGTSGNGHLTATLNNPSAQACVNGSGTNC